MLPDATTRSVRTLTAADEEIVSLGLRSVLAKMTEIVLVAEVRDGKSAVAKAAELSVDLVVMDRNLSVLDGIEAARLIKTTLSAKVVIISAGKDSEEVIAGLAAGVDAYCIRRVGAAQLTRVIRAILDGGMWLDPAVTRVVRGHRLVEPAAGAVATGKLQIALSPREREVLRLLSTGLTNQQIAERLSVAPETVKTHIRHVMEKLGVTDRTQAAVKALVSGWLENKS